MESKYFGKFKNSASTKAVALLLCFCMLTSILQSFIISANAVSEPSVSIYRNGNAVKTIELLQSEKAEIIAFCTPENSNYTYQWQILADRESELWVDIYDKTEKNLLVSNALISRVLDNFGSAYVRAVVRDGSLEGVSEPVEIKAIMEEQTGKGTDLVYTVNQNAVQTTEIINSDLVSVKINYLDAVTGLPIYTSYTAQITKGSEHIQSVVSPTYIGYRPYYNPNMLSESDADNCNVLADTVEINIPASYEANEYTVNVYYKAIKVNYAVKYFFQNIGDDFYTEDDSLYWVGSAETGTIITDAELSIEKPGFTKLYHYPQSVAGDGSTVFECYYDRNYSMIKFDLCGGYGVEPIYARFGTPILVNEPIRGGYNFKGWQLMDKFGNYGESLSDIPSTVPETSCTYRAVWEEASTSYAVAYWLQNADDDEYDYIGTEMYAANSGDIVEANDTLRYNAPICGERSIQDPHDHTDGCYAQGFNHYIYDKEKTESVNKSVTVKGDGSTVLNIYYTRQYYTLRFVYAKEYNAAYDVQYPNLYKSGYSIVGGSTYGFGNKNTGAYWPNGKGNDYTLSELMQSLKKYESGTDKWGNVEELPVLKSTKYETGMYPAAGEGYNGGDYDYYGDRYYYFDITARYGADLSTLWPTDVFEPIKVPAHSQSKDAMGEGEWGNYAYLAGWNGEYKINYSLQKANSTIKCIYQKLDEGILFGSVNMGTSGTKKLSYEEDTKTQRTITAVSTINGETVSSYLNYYLAFFNNGASFSWNIPREWIYEYYVPVLEGNLSSEQEELIKNSKEPITLGNGWIYYYYEPNNVIYHLAAKVVTSDDNRTAEHQTQCSLVGFDFAGEIGSGLTDKCSRAEKIYNGILEDKRESYTLRLFYERKLYSFGMYNYNDYYEKYDDVPYKTTLDKFVLDENGDYIVPNYPEGIEENAYTFGGWYTSHNCYDGTEYVPGSKMSNSNSNVYAKWTPNVYTVNLFKSYNDMVAYENGDTSVAPIETRKVKHGELFGTIADPENGGFEFSGWFYIKNGEKNAYTPLDIPIKSNLNIYAEWNSRSAQPYIIHYALENSETNSAWINELQKAAGAMPSDNRSYTVTLGTETRSYVYLESDKGYHLKIADSSEGYAYQGNMRTFLPKTGEPFNQLYSDYNSGYYPTLSSHSIAIAYEEDKDVPVHNIFTFTYVYLESVDYRVEYRYKETNALITLDGVGDNGSGVANKRTSMGVVTERFVPVTDYIADAFYKKLIISVEKDSSGNYVGSKNNVLTFYYTQNSENAYYAVHFMLENLDGSGYTESSTVTEGIAKIGNKISVVPTVYSGFTPKDTAELKTANSETALEITNGSFTFDVDRSGSELYIYYTRNTQSYAVYYLLDGTDISDLSNLPEGSILADTDRGHGKYGATVVATAKDIANYSCTSDVTKSMVLHSNNSGNYIVFFYTPLSYTVQYKVWDLGGGTLDATNETGTGGFRGSAPTANEGYSFKGWYLDEECTVPVGEIHTIEEGTNRLIPDINNLNPQPKSNIFYAKFVPALGNVTITRNNCNDESNGDQTFVYKITSLSDDSFELFVTITGNASVTIKDLPMGNYKIEQQAEWSWRYDDAPQIFAISEGQTVSITYEKEAVFEKWLSGNSKPIHNIKNKE